MWIQILQRELCPPLAAVLYREQEIWTGPGYKQSFIGSLTPKDMGRRGNS